MFLRKKEQLEIGTICNNIYDISIHITEKISNILSNYSYTVEVQSHKALFTSVTLMYCFNFFEIVLKKNYNYNEQECFKIIYLLLKELNSHLENVSLEMTIGAYNDVKSVISNHPPDSPEEYIVIYYLAMAIEYDEDEIETKLLLDVYGEFNSILKNIYKIM